MAGRDLAVDAVPIVRSITCERSDGIVNLVQQRSDLRAVIEIIGGQRRRDDSARVGIDTDVQLAPATLAKLACLGGGPPFESFGRRPLYREADLLAWAQSRTSGPRRSTSDAGLSGR